MNKDKESLMDDNIDENQNNQADEQLENEGKPQEESSLEKDYADLKDRNLRLFAEFENFKKRTTKERLDLYKTANESLLVDLLPVLDDFERGINQSKNSQNDSDNAKGMELIYNKFLNILESKGLKRMETNQGDDFDLEKHEAITQIDAPSEDLKGKVMDLVETGYMLNEKVIRYAKVVVGK